MFDIFRNRLEITGTLKTITAFRISKKHDEAHKPDLQLLTDSFGQPLIPGSSFKGAMRSRLESFLRAIDPAFAANPTIESEWSITHERLNGKHGIKQEVETNLQKYPPEERNAKRDKLLTEKMISETDLVSLLFGSPWIASKFQVRDLNVVTDTWFGQYQSRDGVVIDRDTETAADKKYYSLQIVPAGVEFEFRAVVENAEKWELGLLMIGLHQFETEQIPLGGGRSRGLGVVKLEIKEMNWLDVDGKPEKLLIYLQELVSSNTSEKIPSYEDGNQFKQDWTKELINKLREKLPKTSATTS